MGALGPRFRGSAKAVADAISACVPGPEGVTLTIDGKEVLITPDLYEVREEVVEIPGEEVTPHVIEPSYGIDRMIYAVLEQRTMRRLSMTKRGGCSVFPRPLHRSRSPSFRS